MKHSKIPTISLLKFYSHAGTILKNPLPFHRENFEKLGDTFQIKLGFGKPIIFSRDPGFAEYVLQKNQKNYIKSPIQTKDMAKYLGQGLLTAEGEHWKKQRKLIQPAFHKKQLVQLLGTIQSAIANEVQKIETGKPIDVFPIFNDLAFQTVVKSLFSSAIGQKEIDRLQYITEAAQKMLVKELRQPYKKWWFYFSGSIKKHTDLTGEARGILQDLIEDRKKTGKREDDLLDMLLDARYDDNTAMDNAQLLDEILILFTAGHETTSNALTFTCELLARNPSAQERIVEEIKEAQEQSEDLMGFLKNCKFISYVIEESMRLYPPAYFIDRKNLEKDEFNGMIIPKGSSVLLSIYEIHRNKEDWADPDIFDPDRFSENKKAGYYPFGAGPRKCIGNNFAMFEMILAIAEIFRQFKIKEKQSAVAINPLITLKPGKSELEFYRY